jgi:hypothetical protein
MANLRMVIPFQLRSLKPPATASSSVPGKPNTTNNSETLRQIILESIRSPFPIAFAVAHCASSTMPLDQRAESYFAKRVASRTTLNRNSLGGLLVQNAPRAGIENVGAHGYQENHLPIASQSGLWTKVMRTDADPPESRLDGTGAAHGKTEKGTPAQWG